MLLQSQALEEPITKLRRTKRASCLPEQMRRGTHDGQLQAARRTERMMG